MIDIIRVEGGDDILERTKAIKNAYAQFKMRQQRLYALDRAYDTGQVPPDDYDVVANNCRVIVDTKTSYIASIPPTYSTAEDDYRGQEVIDLFQRQHKPRVDQQIARYCAKYGLGIEVGYIEADSDGKLVPKSVAVTPLESFVAWDWSLDPKPVFGAIHYMEVDDNQNVHHYLDVYDSREKVRYALASDSTGTWEEVPGTRAPHGFQRVPVIEYRNNPDMRGDFEAVIPLQRALNEVLSDRVKDKSRFASALLVSQGVALGDTDTEVEDMLTRLKDEQVIAIPRDASLNYLTKTFDETSVQVLVDYIDRQMHKVSGVPDLTSESFAGNTSGVAIKWSMQSMENLAQSFIAEFLRGFAVRCKLYSDALFGDEDAIDNQSITATFRFNVPSDDAGDAQTMQAYVTMGALSKRTVMEHCPYVDNPDMEEERLQTEADESTQRQREAFDDNVFSRMEEGDEDADEEDDDQEDEDGTLSKKENVDDEE